MAVQENIEENEQKKLEEQELEKIRSGGEEDDDQFIEDIKRKSQAVQMNKHQFQQLQQQDGNNYDESEDEDGYSDEDKLDTVGEGGETGLQASSGLGTG